MTTLLYRNPRLLLLALGMIVALAVTALGQIARQEDPTITNLFATVVTPYPGAEPSRVESLVTEKIEDKLREIPEIDEIKSTSRTGISMIAIELSLYTPKDRIEQVWSEVRDALSDAARELPSGVSEPELDTDRTGAYTMLGAVEMAPGLRIRPAILHRHAEILQNRLRQIKNTKNVRLFGEQNEEVSVVVLADRLAALGLGFERVAAALAQADAKVRAGELRGTHHDLLIEIDGEIDSLERIRTIPVAIHAEGAVVRVGDLARVDRSVRDPSVELAFADGRPVVLVAARMENDKQVDAWAGRARAAITDFQAELPDDLRFRLLFDQSDYTEHRFQTLGLNLGLGIALVVGVLVISLGWRSAVVVASIIPLATLISITAMQAIGLTVQQMSVTGLIVALGLLVDAGIVMCDEIGKRLAAGQDKLTAVGGSVRRLAVPLLASTATTVLAFVPMARLPGPAGDFVGSIALTVIIMLVVSLVLAVTVAPAIGGWMLPKDGRASRGLSLPWAERVFAASIGLALRNRALSILGAMVLPLMGFASFPTLTAQFFPGVDRDQFYVQVTLPDGTAIAETERLALAIDRNLRAQADIERVVWVVGESAPAFYYNMKMDRDGEPGFAEALITSSSPEATDRLIPALQAELDRDFPQAQILVRGLVQGPPVDAPVELKIAGPNLEILRRLGDETRAVMSGVGEIDHTRANLTGGAAKLVFRIDEDKARLAGLTLADVARQMEAALAGAAGGSLVEAGEELPVRARLAEGERDRLDALRAVLIVPPGADTALASEVFPGIPLGALGRFDLVPSDSPISRLNGVRVNTVQGFIPPHVLPEEVLAKVRGRLAEQGFAIPPGYRVLLGGDADARAETAANLAASAPLVVVLTVVAIVLTFGSYRLSIITFLVAGLSMGSSVLALAVFGYPFGIQALIGAIGSIGVSVNAAIIVLTALQENERAMAGDREAIRDVVVDSARHIVSTTVTTVGGFLPLILAGGGFWPPFAMAIAGGVALSAVLAFFFTPPMFALLVGRRRAATAAEPARIEAMHESEPDRISGRPVAHA